MIKKVQRALKRKGLESELTGINCRDGEHKVLKIEHNYEGLYPTRESVEAHCKAFQVAIKYGLECESRGCNTCTFIIF